jgi:hypothetical protein
MKKGISTIFAFLLGAVFIIVVGGAYYVGTKLKNNEQPEVIPPIQTGTPPVVATISSTVTSTITPSTDETAVIKEAMKQAIIAKRGASANELTFTVSKIIGNYAQGGASSQGGGAMWFGVKVNGKWTLIWDGNGVILCSDLVQYPDVPKIMIPECYNDKTNKTVIR